MLTDQIATFSKVSLEQYIEDCKAICGDHYPFDPVQCEENYKKIKLPSRATSGSVGFDFYLPHNLSLNMGEFIIIATGIRCQMKEGYSLDIYPKSGLGFKNFTTIANTVGIIDSDYFYSDNEGHILVKLINKGFHIIRDKLNPDEDVYRILNRKQGESFVQGILHECFGATNDNDNTEMKVRNGGFDSTR